MKNLLIGALFIMAGLVLTYSIDDISMPTDYRTVTSGSRDNLADNFEHIETQFNKLVDTVEAIPATITGIINSPTSVDVRIDNDANGTEVFAVTHESGDTLFKVEEDSTVTASKLTVGSGTGLVYSTSGVYSTVSMIGPGGANTDVQYNNSGVFGGNSSFTYNGSGAITLTGGSSSGIVLHNLTYPTKDLELHRYGILSYDDLSITTSGGNISVNPSTFLNMTAPTYVYIEATSGDVSIQAAGGSSDIDLGAGNDIGLSAGRYIDLSASDDMTLSSSQGIALSASAEVDIQSTTYTGLTADTYIDFSALSYLKMTATEINVHANASSGETRSLNISGYRAGDALRTVSMRIDSSTNNAFSVSGVGAYNFDGTVTSSNLTVGSGSGLVLSTSGVYSTVTDSRSNWDAAYTHISSNGSDHTYINQDVRTSASPTFNGATIGSGSGLVLSTTGVLSTVTDQRSNWNAAYTHVSSNGSDHGYIDQDVTTTGTPTFAGVILSNKGTTLMTYTGFTTTVQGNIQWEVCDRMVIISGDAISGTSNATSMTVTGLPSALQPVYEVNSLAAATDNGGTVNCVITITAAGSISIYNGVKAGTWTASGTKGVYGWSVAYVTD